MSLLQMSFAGAVLILVILILRLILFHRLPKSAFFILWGIVVLRLLVPFSVASEFSIYTQAEKVRLRFAAEAGSTEDAQGEFVQEDWNTEEKTPESIQENTQANRAFSEAGAEKKEIRKLIWMIGAAGLSVYFAICYMCCIFRFRFAVPVDDRCVQMWLKNHPLKRKISICETDMTATPLTYGILKPVILLPKTMEWEKNSCADFVLEHEWIHIRRWDGLGKLFLNAALCLHWFNPLVWVMYVMANRDMELSCDEQVLRVFGETFRFAYARALISMEESRNAFIPFGNSFGRQAIEERIVAIMKYKKISVITTVLTGILVLSVTALCATSAVETPDGTKYYTISEEPGADVAEEISGESVENSSEEGRRYSGEYMVYTGDFYPEYKAAGITYDVETGYLMYKNQVIGAFTDEFEPGVYTHVGQPDGTLSVKIIRDSNGDIEKVESKPLEEAADYAVMEQGAEEVSQETDSVSEITWADSEQSVAYEDVTGTVIDDEGFPNKQTETEYQKFGITRSSAGWKYKGKEIAVLYDESQGVFSSDSGEVYVLVQRDEKGHIKEIKELTETEMDSVW